MSNEKRLGVQQKSLFPLEVVKVVKGEKVEMSQLQKKNEWKKRRMRMKKGIDLQEETDV